MPRYVLGFDCYMQDSAACLLRDGRVLHAVEEERLTRQKNTGVFPERAIRWCLDEAGISARELDTAAFNMRPWEGLAARGRQVLGGLPHSLALGGSRGGNWLRMLAARRTFHRRIGRPQRWRWVRHHDAHAASAFWPSGFERAAVMVVDGSGELASTSSYAADADGLSLLGSVPFPHSLGYFYSALTQWLGFQPAVAEGKTMGLSSFGEVEPQILAHFRAMIADDGRVDPSFFRFQYGGSRYWGHRWLGAFGPPRVPESDFTDRHYAVAAAGQRRLEEVLFASLRALHERTRASALCLAGGVALNCVANGRIRAETPFESLFVQPVAHDAGTAYGAALAVAMERGAPRPSRQRSVAWGPRWDTDTIDRAIALGGRTARRLSEPHRIAAELLAAGNVIGWFQGRAEMGPRALGYRSILADPRVADMADRVNARVKRREAFRPFAPAVLAERAGDWFVGEPTPFMTVVCDVRPERRSLVPSITHVDGTARVQTVDRAENPAFHALIEAFGRLTGVPMVLNTSFNVRGEPIVSHPQDALFDFEHTDLDALILEDRLLQKPA